MEIKEKDIYNTNKIQTFKKLTTFAAWRKIVKNILHLF
jgi:hypothetical protein